MNYRKIVLATNNKNKIKEIKNILSDYQILSMSDAGIDIEPDETGFTFIENALIKAEAVSKYTQYPVISDDSGLMVDCLSGEPGVFSKRYAKENATDEENNNYLISKLINYKYEERTARFVCCIAMVLPDGKKYTFEGKCDGMITLEPKGKNGFGYDPLFYIPQLNKTLAELSMEEKNKISHRAQALKLLKHHLTGSEI